MALEFIDGFDHYTTTAMAVRKWGTGAALGGSVTGRFSVGFAGNLQNCTNTKTLTAVGTRVCGFAFQCTTAGLVNGVLAAYLDAGTAQVELRLITTGALQLTRNATVVATSAAGLIVQSVWNYIEWKCTIGSSAAYEIRLNGVNVLSGTGNTQNTANSTVNQFRIGPWSNIATQLYDDLYVLNTSGSFNNDFLGDCRIFTSFPTGDDASFKDFTPSTGTTHFSLVDETQPNDDTDYVSSSTVDHIDLFTYPSISTAGMVAGIQTVISARKDDAGTREIAEQCRSASANYTGTSQVQTASYQMLVSLRETDPATAVAWTLSGVNAAEFGVKVIA